MTEARARSRARRMITGRMITGRMITGRVTGLALAVLAGSLLAACNGGPLSPGAASTPATTATAAATGDPSASPSGPVTGSPTPGSTDTAVPTGTPTPGTGPSGATPSDGLTPSTTAAASPLTCTSVLPRRLGRVTVAAARTTDVATVVSDGRILTPGTSQQTDFAEPQLVGPNGGVITDANSIAQAADLARTARVRVLTTRPDAPDAKADVSRRPFDTPGTYAVYNASGLMTAQLVVLCSGQEQTWEFRAEANPVNGVVNCAVEPARSNALARSVYQTSC